MASNHTSIKLSQESIDQIARDLKIDNKSSIPREVFVVSLDKAISAGRSHIPVVGVVA